MMPAKPRARQLTRVEIGLSLAEWVRMWICQNLAVSLVAAFAAGSLFTCFTAWLIAGMPL